ncbi:MAG: methyltransferase, partial [Candidatus Eremiobacterota bacterium]
GVHAVLAGAHAGEAWGVDINPRALEISRINAVLNGLEATCRFVQGSLYDPVPEGRFGLVTANPPFVPTPRGDLALFRPGGETGEAITEAIVRGLPERLEVGGTLALVSQCPVLRGSHVLDRVERWLGGPEGWGLAYLMLAPLDREGMIAGHVTSLSEFVARLGPEEGDRAYRREFETWLDSYEQNGIVGMELAITYVRRLQPGHAGWRAEWHTSFPEGSLSDWVEAWLDAQERFSGPQAWEWKPVRAPGFQRLMVDVRNGEGFVFRKPAYCGEDSLLPPESAFLLQHADGHRSARDLLDWFQTRYGRDSAREVSNRLAELGRQLLLT